MRLWPHAFFNDGYSECFVDLLRDPGAAKMGITLFQFNTGPDEIIRGAFWTRLSVFPSRWASVVRTGMTSRARVFMWRSIMTVFQGLQDWKIAGFMVQTRNSPATGRIAGG
jgi:hypothetical protein